MPSREETLREVVDRTAVLAKTKRLDVSFNELLDMYRSEPPELEISPAFQRVFVWDDQQQSQFIESLLLELPIPPIYVIEHGEEGHYLLIDGLQRLSSYLHFRGSLENSRKSITNGDFLKLVGCDIVKELNGKAWVDLDTALQIRLKRAFVSLQVIRKESLPDLKYHMFKRLNSGGSPISRQQIRNAYVRMLEYGDKIMDFAHHLSQLPEYIATVTESLTSEQRDFQDDEGFVVRFLAFKNNLENYVHDVDPFIDDYIEAVARGPEHPQGRPFDYAKEEAEFRKIFQVLAASTRECSFTYPNKSRTELTSGFSVYHFEGVSLGIQRHLTRLDPSNETQMTSLKQALRDVRLGEEFRQVSAGGGKNSSGLMTRRIDIVSKAIASVVSGS